MNEQLKYGVADNTFQAAGGQPGVTQLVGHFYDIMSSEQEYLGIWNLHPKGNVESRDRLARFLCAWMGGPRLYKEKYGPISIPGVHAHLTIGEYERDQWLACMHKALLIMDYDQALVDYLIRQLAVPAERIFQRCQKALTDK